ncbi:hypothetical protein PIB30_055844 [Stylosanthes scabra]|uniref:Uncharacterized protein n=1 Tax=Stylosanthes scabra TaxID=79078 RepID=A0ABU6ZHV7_9FABA|nr:hypothetical protein [Stylosanthes scabra]
MTSRGALCTTEVLDAQQRCLCTQRRYMRNRKRTVVKLYPVTDIVECEQQPTYELMTCTRIRHASYLDNVADFMKTSPPTERILDISGFTISRLRSVPPGGTSRGARQPSSTRQMEKLSMSLVYDRVFPSPCSTFEG